ncbi:pantoate kinase [Methanobrevibacter olleyae]|uniref:Pantoate kinase n=1 Tax=Methanobrevibacter olleyae TaxID=294671 RepID=A0A126QYK8_METOL|nr:pantoate kinase [Methanobrevibacter olleyae]AMK15111.1 pantothenate kinase CoaA [Methanobrevibacter olleyae]SFL51845.1 pantoate kinase [Methanobrevibacter olleyae]
MISVFVPSHITGFFSIFDNENPLLKGSLGAGVLLDKGVITEISKIKKEKENDSSKDLTIMINDKKDEYNEIIILKTLELMKKDLNKKNILFNLENIIINQRIQVPIGCGFGTSAASAIGTAICINEFFNLDLSIEECGQYAHLAEISLGTGLGDVIAELSKGIVLRTKVGAPAYGEVKSLVPHEKQGFGISLSEESNFYVITKTFGEISTSSIIENEKHKKVITDVGFAIGEEFNKKDDGIVIGSKFKSKFNVAVDSEFNEEETIKKFMKSSLSFAKKTHLINDDLLKIVHLLDGKVLGSSMAMLGNTIFAIANEKQKLKLEAEYYNEFDFYKLETKGIRINNIK